MSTVLADGAKTSAILDHIGRSDTPNFYIGEYEKTEERERVAAFMLSYSFDTIKLLSMPGLSWSFETLLSRKRKTQIVGLENRRTIFLRSRRLMVGRQGTLSNRIRAYGSSEYMYARTTRRSGANRESIQANRLLLMNASTYATALVTNYGQSFDDRREFHRRFCHRNAVWLDFTSQFCAEVDRAIEAIHYNVDCFANGGAKPFVVTILGCRDQYDSTAQRVAHIERLQPRFKALEMWPYEGKNGSPMLTVAGELC